MKVFGHYVARPVALLAAMDAALFLGFLHLLSLGRHCRGCYVGSFLDLKLYESLLLTAIFLAMSISVGVYNRDALQDFRVFLLHEVGRDRVLAQHGRQRVGPILERGCFRVVGEPLEEARKVEEDR